MDLGGDTFGNDPLSFLFMDDAWKASELRQHVLNTTKVIAKLLHGTLALPTMLSKEELGMFSFPTSIMNLNFSLKLC